MLLVQLEEGGVVMGESDRVGGRRFEVRGMAGGGSSLPACLDLAASFSCETLVMGVAVTSLGVSIERHG